MESGSASSRAQVATSPILALLVSATAVACILAADWLGNYGVRLFEVRAGYFLARLADYNFIFVLVGIAGAVVGLILGRRARRGFAGAASAAAVVLAYLALAGAVMVIGKVLRMDWPPLHSTSEDRAVAVLRAQTYCLDQFQVQDPQHRLPRTLKELDKPGLAEGALWTKGNLAGYVFTYSPGPGAPEGRMRYTLLARPERFGFSGRANFFSDETGVVRWTLEDRPATSTDDPYGQH